MAIQNAALQAKEQTILEVQLSQIESRMLGLFETQKRIQSATERLFNPRPETAGTGQADVPAPCTIEGRLQNAVRTMDVLQSYLDDIANTLDRGV